MVVMLLEVKFKPEIKAFVFTLGLYPALSARLIVYQKSPLEISVKSNSSKIWGLNANVFQMGIGLYINR